MTTAVSNALRALPRNACAGVADCDRDGPGVTAARSNPVDRIAKRPLRAPTPGTGSVAGRLLYWATVTVPASVAVAS
jgi:hypothetical protein